MQQYENALKDHKTYLKLSPLTADIWYEMGITHYRLGKQTEALDNLNRAIQLKKDQPLYFLERGKIQINRGNKAAGLQDLQSAQNMGLQVDPAYFDAARN